MNIYKGTHGTSLTRFNNINLDGFKSQSGIRGTGAYFWKNSSYPKMLAVGWHNYSKTTRDEYRNDKEQQCVVVYAKLEAAEDEVLNCEDLSECLAKWLAESPKLNTESNEEIAGLYDLVIEETEKELKKKFKIFIAYVGL